MSEESTAQASPGSDSPQMATSWTDQINAARAALGRSKRKAVPKSESSSGSSRKESDSEIDKELAELLKPENLRDMLRAPADYMLLRTGHPHWNIENKEIDKSAVPVSLIARRYVTFDPIYIALMMALINLGNTYGSRIILELSLIREAKQQEAKKTS